MVSIQKEVLDDIVYLEVKLRHGMLKGLFNVPDVFLEQFGQDGQIPIPKADLIDIGVLLP